MSEPCHWKRGGQVHKSCSTASFEQMKQLTLYTSVQKYPNNRHLHTRRPAASKPSTDPWAATFPTRFGWMCCIHSSCIKLSPFHGLPGLIWSKREGQKQKNRKLLVRRWPEWLSQQLYYFLWRSRGKTLAAARCLNSSLKQRTSLKFLYRYTQHTASDWFSLVCSFSTE